MFYVVLYITVRWFYKYNKSSICKDCINIKRRKQYQENEEYRLRRREVGIEYKKKKKAIRDEKKLVELKKLEEEIGDLLAMIALLEQAGVVTEAGLHAAFDNKIAKLKRWSKIYG